MPIPEGPADNVLVGYNDADGTYRLVGVNEEGAIPVVFGATVTAAPTAVDDGDRVRLRASARGALLGAADYRTIYLDSTAPNPTGNDILVGASPGGLSAPQATDFAIRDTNAHTFWIPLGASGWRDFVISVATTASFDQILTQVIAQRTYVGGSAVIAGGAGSATLAASTAANSIYISGAGGGAYGVGNGGTYSIQGYRDSMWLMLRWSFTVAPTAGALILNIERRS